MRARDLLGGAERQRIEAAVREAERDTTGEILVVVVGRCEEYPHAGWRLGSSLAALVMLGIGAFGLRLPWVELFGVLCVAVLSGHALVYGSALRRLVLSEAELERAAQRRAFAAFVEHGVHHTAGATGILLLVALFERRVVVLGDEGVNRRLDPTDSWEDVVALALDGIRAGRAVEGLLAAVARCGEILAKPLPAGPENPDEIPRGVVVED